MMKKIIAIIAALAMMLSLVACGSYEITIIQKGDETNAASDTIEEYEEEPEEYEEEPEEEYEEEPEEEYEEEYEEEPEEEYEEEPEEEYEEEPEEETEKTTKKTTQKTTKKATTTQKTTKKATTTQKTTKKATTTQKTTKKTTEAVKEKTTKGKYNASFEEVEKYLLKYIDLDSYANQPEADAETSFGYSMKTSSYKETSYDFNLKINGKKIEFPTVYSEIKAAGFSFHSSMYNEKSEQNPHTTALGWYMDAPGGGNVDIYSVNLDDYKKPVTELDFYGITLYGLTFSHGEYKKSERYTKMKINDSITFESDIGDIVEEFGVPNILSFYLSELDGAGTTIALEYVADNGYGHERLTFRMIYSDGKTRLESVKYVYPEEGINA